MVIHEELGRLPERLRAPLVLCYLQGMTHELAAGQLCCPVGTVRSRLSRARHQLSRRITRRGLTLSAAGLVSSLNSNSSAAAVPPIVRITLIKLATGWVSDSSATVPGSEPRPLSPGYWKDLERHESQEARNLCRRPGRHGRVGPVHCRSREGCWRFTVAGIRALTRQGPVVGQPTADRSNRRSRCHDLIPVH